MSKISKMGLSGCFARLLLVSLLVGLCQPKTAALNPVIPIENSGINAKDVRLNKGKVSGKKYSSTQQGISDSFMCNIIPETSYSEYAGIYLNDDYVWSWGYNDIQTYEDNQTVLTYGSTQSFGFIRYNDAPNIEAVKVYLDPTRTNDATFSAYVDGNDGYFYNTGTEVVTDYEHNVIYWYPESPYQEENIYFYLQSGELNMIGFEIYSEGNVPVDFKTTYQPASTVAPPVFKPSSCKFSDPLTVEILAEEGCDIYYTTSGYLFPGDGNKYDGPVVISSTTTFKAMAVDAAGNSSLVSTAVYTCLRHGIGEDYDPDSPGNPESGDDAEKDPVYHLTVVANPVGAGSVSSNYTDPIEGQEVRLWASKNSGFSFVNWTIEGKEVSTESTFYYVMPAYDVTIVANFNYNPDSPGNPSPEEQKVKHPVVVRTIPSGYASLSPSGVFDMDENASRNIYVYPIDGWHLSGWEINGEQLQSTTSPINITMGEKALDIVAYLTYNPSSPSNPGANYYNPTTGQVIIDDFTPGYLYDALSNLVGYNNFSNISSLIVKGEVTSNDLGNLSYFSNAGTIDISRTGGVSSLPSYTFSSVGASSIVLPSTISSLGNYVFDNCESLISLTIYSLEPPSCNRYTFSNFTNKDNCIVYVPASALELYSNADYWRNFTILPITSDAHVLQINLPADASDGRYKNNSLEIVNINSGVRQKYVISDRLLYTFNGLQKDEQYNIYLFSQAGLEIGRIENVTIPDQDIEVTFDNLKKLYTVLAKVSTHDGKDVTSDVTVEWLKPLADGTTTYLRKATSLGEIPEGQALICRVTLNNQLGTVYAIPEDTEFTVNTEQNTCTVNLVPFRSIALSGTVVDGDGAALSGASVSVNQTLNGKYSKSYTAKTDRQGKWTISVLDAPETRLTFAATECVNVNDTIGALEPEISTLDLGKTTMKSIVGARVTYGFTYHAAGSEDIQDYYSDYQNVLVSVYNVTQNRAHNDVSLQYPILAVLDENINTGDELRLTATSKTGAFNPIVETVTVGENLRAEVTFDIVGKGGIQAAFEMTDNPAVIAMLYSSKGELLKKQIYSEAQTTFTELEDGDYTLVSMGRSDLMNSILRLSNFSEIGLSEGKDYIKNVIKVESGKLSEVKNSEIPAFDESLFYYTNSSTSFSSNKSSITTGNYLTLRAAIDFKDVYKNDISNVALVVDLPEACDFVEQSVIQGPNLLPYTIDNNRLTVQLGNAYTAQTRFCVIPTNGGSFNATASIVFDYNGKTVTQPIGSATSEIKDIEITVPSVVAGERFIASGLAVPNSFVKVFDSGIEIGSGKSNSIGTWSIECKLDNPYNLTRHEIHAEIITTNNNTLVTESKDLIYDYSALMVSKVTMVNTAHPASSLDLCDYVTIYDFQNPSEQPAYWYWPSYPKFTFMLEFTDNDPNRISNVVLYVHTTTGNVVALYPEYNEIKHCWLVQQDFDSNSLPENVSVDFDAFTEKYLDNDQLVSEYNSLSNLQEQLTTQNQAIDEIYYQIKEELNKDSINFEIVDELNQKLEVLMGVSISSDDIDISEEELYNQLEIFKQEYGEQSIDELVESNLRAIEYSIPEELGFGKISVSTCDGFDMSTILNDSSYEKLKITGDKIVFAKATETSYILLDFDEDVCYTIIFDPNSEIAMFARAASNDVSAIQKHSNTIGEKIKAANELLNKLLGAIDEVVQHIDGGLKFAQDGYGSSWRQLRKLKQLQEAGEKVAVQRIFLLELTCDGWEAQIKTLKGIKSALTNCRAQVLGKLFGVCGVISNFVECKNDLDKFINLYYSVPQPCENEQDRADNIRNSIRNAGIAAGFYYVANISADVCALFGIGPSIAAAPASGGSSLAVALVAVGKIALSYGINALYRNSCDAFMNNTKNDIESLQCKKKECGDPGMPPCPKPTPNNNGGNNGKTGPNGKGGDHQSGCPKTGNVMDPSGYVYEAIPQNRVEGVQASIYYKETKEDMYGDPYEEVILWNAEEYAQQNPLFTDKNGLYQWDVPQGLWQVKFEKDGYVTAYSEWLPVPPPQLEVNIGIVQNKQPEVTEARAYEGGVEVQFDKYMDLSTLTAENIFVSANGEKLKGEISFVDSELADEYASEEDVDAIRYASRIRFVPEESLSVTTGEVRLTVSRNVLSYAGIPMTQTFSQVLSVEKEVQAIAADDVKVLYGGEKEVTIYAVPFDAAAGRKLHISNSSELILTVDNEDVILDDEGKASVIVKGGLPGRAQLSFSIEDVTVTGDCAVDVVTEIINAEAPKSSRASGTAVYRGTKVELTTESKDGVIYFTTDGSCPCDENGTRRKYTVPIIINEDTKILAMTSVGNGDDDVSETVEFNYTLKRSDMDFAMDEGWTWISHNFETPVATETLAADKNVQRIISQTQEVIRDPQLGMVGMLKELNASESYKVETSSATTRRRLSEIAWNPAIPIALNSGWNWLGYPVSQTMSVDEAFAPTAAENLDVIVGQNGFAQFDGENWVGTLETLSPGLGYMYQSQSPKNVVYNTSIVSTASAQYVAGISQNSSLVLDIHKYPSVMPVVATIMNLDGMILDNEDYQVNAFCGTECRGIGRVVNGLVMMNVYGNANDKITFQVTDNDGSVQFANNSSLSFSEQIVGNIYDPFAISVNSQSGISNVTYDGNIKVNFVGDMLIIKGIAADDIDLVEVYDMDGRKLIHETNVSESGIRISNLNSGVYIVIVNGNGEYTYHKIALR